MANLYKNMKKYNIMNTISPLSVFDSGETLQLSIFALLISLMEWGVALFSLLTFSFYQRESKGTFLRFFRLINKLTV